MPQDKPLTRTFSGHPLTMPENKVTTATRRPYTCDTLMTTCFCLTRAIRYMQAYTHARIHNQSPSPTPITDDLFLLKEKYKPRRSTQIKIMFILTAISLQMSQSTGLHFQTQMYTDTNLIHKNCFQPTYRQNIVKALDMLA